MKTSLIQLKTSLKSRWKFYSPVLLAALMALLAKPGTMSAAGIPVSITCSSNITVTATDSSGAVVFYTVTASGGCTPPNVLANPPSGSTFPVGTTMVNASASDTCGNTTNCGFTVTVNPPIQPPAVICSTNIEAGGNSGGATVDFTVGASGGDPGCPLSVVTFPYNSGDTLPLGETFEYVYLFDCNNNFLDFCSFTVDVTDTNSAPLVVTCPTNITVTATGGGGAVANFTVGITGGCAPVSYYTSPYNSGATFPIGTTTEYVYVYDSCVGSYVQYCSFTVTVNPPSTASAKEYFSLQPLLPPANTVYISPAQWHTLYANGIVIRDVRHRFFTQNYPLPALGNTATENFSSEVDFQLSTDSGATYHPATGTASVTVQITHSFDNGGLSFFNTEMTQLSLTGSGIILRESPTIQSTGQTTVRQVPGGYMISSFFDVFTEVSLDNGLSWTPATDSGHMEMRPDPKSAPSTPEPTPLLPPPNGHYVSPAQWHALFAQGIVIKDVSHTLFTGALQPPSPGVTNTHSFNSVLNLKLSTDGGATFQQVHVTAPVQVTVANASSSTDNSFYDTEMTSLSMTLPGGVMIRESSTMPSRGATEMTLQSDGSYRINSFFDIFVELSLDGGATWSPGTNGPVRMQLTDQAPEVLTSTPNLPLTNSPYVSPAQWHALYANGIIVSNVTHRGFLQTQPPPPPGGNQTENFGSTVDGMISVNGGASFQPFSAPASVAVQVNSRSDLDTGNTRFFDTEMLSLSLSGGNLPGGIMVRESPAQASQGRTSVRTDGGNYHISSFFDIFTEVSLDGGNSWSPSVSGPGTMAPASTNNGTALNVNCSTNIIVQSTSSSGAVVFYTVSATGGCSAPTVTANPPSGSTFPLGTSTVFVNASDTCGNNAQCSFTVTVTVQPLSINCSSNITVNATGSSGATVFYTVSASGGCSPPPLVIANPPSGSTFPVGTTIVNASASDTCGNSTNCSFSVTVVRPLISLTCSSNITVTATGSSGAVVFFTASAAGGCSPPPFIVANPPSGSTFPVGTTLVTVTASDNCGTSTNCSFNVTVNPPVYPPIVLTCSSNITVNATGSSGATVFFSLTATGGCSAPIVVANPPSGSTFPVGTTMVNVTASDTCGHSTNCSFSVTVVKPSISLTCSSNITVTATGSSGSVVFFTVSATGGCNPPPIVIANPPSGSTFPVGTTLVTVTASDTCGTFTNCSFNVTVVRPPISLICSSNITVTATSTSGSVVFFTVSATGGCSLPLVNANPPSGSTFPTGTTTVNVTASDNCATFTNCSFTVTVNPPTADLVVTKGVSTNAPGPYTNSLTVQTGQLVYFQIGIANNGPTIASNVVINDLLPPGLTYVTNSNAGNPFTYNSTTGTWTIGTVYPNSGIAYMYIYAVGTGTGTYTNTATVPVPGGVVDPMLTNNTASAVATVVLPQADLVVTKGVGTNAPGPYTNSLTVQTGQLVYFQIGIANNGPTIASNVVINDLLPPGLTYVTNSNAGNPFTYNSTTGTWTVGTVYPNSGIAYMYIYAVGVGTGTYTNTATAPVPGGVVDPILSNNTASAVATVVQPQADLVVTKAVSTNAPGPYFPSLAVQAGSLVYFQIGIANNGPNIASNVVINDLLPPGLTYVTNSNAGNPFTYNSATGVWTVGTVYPNSGTAYMYLYATGTNAGLYTNTATAPVPGGLTDPSLTNNTAKAVAQIYQVYSLSGFVRGCQTNGPPVPFTTVNLSGAASRSTLTDTNGFYSFSNLLAGSYTVTPVQPGNTFAPASATVALSVNTNLPAFVSGVGQIRGRLSYTTNGVPIAGALVALSGATNRTVLTDPNGVYAFTNTPPGTYTVTPVATNGYVFTPTNAVVVIVATNCTGQANFVAGNRKVLLVALEVVQVVQDWSNTVPLIEAKKTYVRAHLQLPTNGAAVLIQNARLFGTRGGSPLPDSPLTPFAPARSPDFLVQTTNAAALRGTFNNSLNFEIPPAWTMGTVTLQFVATNNVTVTPTNVVPANSSVSVTFVPTQIPPLKFFAFNWTNWGNTNFQTINAANYATVPARVTAVYPVPDITAERSVLVPPSTLNVPKTIPLTIPAGDRTIADWALLNANAKLLQMQAMDWLLSLRFGYTNWIYCGVLAGPSPGTLGWAGAYVTSSNTLASRAQNVSSSFLQTVLYGPGSARQTIPHEIGHNLGFPHDVNFMVFGITPGGFARGACNTGLTNDLQFPIFQPIPPPTGALKPTLGPMTNGANAMAFGLDTFTLLNSDVEPVANPNNCFDLMSYCRSNSPLERWSSTFMYSSIRNAINTQFPPPPPPPPPGPPRQWRFIRGFVDADTDIGGFEPSWTVPSTVSTPPPAPPAGDYVAALLDINGNVIESIPFTPVPFVIEETEAEEDLFSIPLLDDPAIKQVTVVNMLNSNIVAHVVASANVPFVSGITLTSTNGGSFTGTGPLVVHWSGFDADAGTVLTYAIQYSTDGGVNWDTLDLDWPDTSYQVDSLYLQATAQGKIRIIASDGFNSSAPVNSSTFTIPNHPPKVSINAPLDGTLLIADAQAVFDVSAIDPQDGPLDGVSVQWSSSLDGVLGYGANLHLQADMLSEGTHTVTVTATDSFALSASAQVVIHVLRQTQPALAIRYIGSQIMVSWPSGQTNYVLESTTSLAPASWSTVTNAPGAYDITQSVNLNLSTTNRFFRLRMP